MNQFIKALLKTFFGVVGIIGVYVLIMILGTYGIIEAYIDLITPAVDAYGIYVAGILVWGLILFVIWKAICVLRSLQKTPFATQIPTWLLVLLGFSPLGVLIPYLLLSAIGVCEGALGSGVQCYLPIGSSYLESTAMWAELSMFIGIGVVWFAAAFLVWGLILLRGFTYFVSIFKRQ
jgi:hypothetical protein